VRKLAKPRKTDELTPQQEKFVQELIKGKSQREAYRKAYPNSKKWKDNSVDVNACRLFNSPKVKLRYEQLKNKVIQKAEEEAIVSAVEVLKELKKIGFADIKDFLSFRTEKTVVGYDEETGDPIYGYAPVIEMKPSDQVDGTLIQEVSINQKGVFTFKLHDKLTALDKLGKYLKLFTEKVEVNEQRENPMANLTTEELKKLIQET